MRALERFGVPGIGPEDVLLTADGDRVLTGTNDGSIWSVATDGSVIERITQTGGRPLGLEWLTDGRLLVCDAHAGLLAVETRGGAIEALVTTVDGQALRFTNNAAVAEDGTIYFSDSTRHYTVEDWKSDLIMHTMSGRLLRRRPDGQVDTVLDGVGFANGVALTADGSQVWVAELALRRIRRLTADGRELAAITELPGYPDNIALGSDGLVWVAIASPPDATLSFLQGRGARLRPAVLRLPEAVKPAPKRTVRVQAYDSTGRLVHDLSADAAEWHMVTGVREHDGRVWLGSLVETSIAVMSVAGGAA
ncbi:SMP-30/gluconolactonase/LRE family protein [Nostocoides sp. F2B08]|uniref:SMP-30/gluconolactonase/LRE family protein n=1 Tax=Nostocoides sp. F2B08 TaxID=2653936 RepID=UPI0012633882|nr:SMP-30/gluconolactonase/LRE family protein [Tetrasphaera sp. F2B08]KAB7744829.1 SMP-30/gluconolactonase/LRE family protein [Tetrasphaera sp. F2B08]